MVEITEEMRNTLDPVVDRVVNALRELELDYPESSTEGNFNYIITQAITQIYTSGVYQDMVDVVGMLETVKLDFYRRMNDAN